MQTSYGKALRAVGRIFVYSSSHCVHSRLLEEASCASSRDTGLIDSIWKQEAKGHSHTFGIYVQGRKTSIPDTKHQAPGLDFTWIDDVQASALAGFAWRIQWSK
eukprot:6199078-Pleurochrysis_carterae.AAC.2